MVLPNALQVDVRALMGFVSDRAVDWIDCLTPGQLGLVTELCDALPPSLTHVMCSGEALPVGTARSFLAKFGDRVGLSNVLSTTETSADICALKHVTLELLDALPESVSLVPVLADVTSHTDDADASRQREVTVAERAVEAAAGAGGGRRGAAARATTGTSAPTAAAHVSDALATDAVAQAAPAAATLDMAQWAKAPASECGVVWNNCIGVASPSGRVVVSGWNVERGYLKGDDSASFEGVEAHTARCTSGDRAYWHTLAPGVRLLCVEGRADSVVKVRGHRIDLAGLEAAFAGCPHLSDCCVLVHDDALWALVVPSAAASAVASAATGAGAMMATPVAECGSASAAESARGLLTSSDAIIDVRALGDATLRDAISRELAAISAFARGAFPPATRPSVLPIASLAYTPTGKRDRVGLRRRLPMMLRALPGAASDGAEVPSAASGQPRPSPMPTGLAATAPAASPHVARAASLRLAFERELGRPVRADEDFFEMGGTSFKALRLAARLDFPIATLFAHPTAASLAAHLESSEGGALVAAAMPPSRPACQPAQPAAAHSPSTPSAAAEKMPSATTVPIVVAGMAVCLPGASSLDGLWRGLQRADGDLLGEVAPPSTSSGTLDDRRLLSRVGRLSGERTDGNQADGWIRRKGTPRHPSRGPQGTLGGSLRRLGVTEEAVRRMSAEQRVLLHLACDALEDAGMPPLQASRPHAETDSQPRAPTSPTNSTSPISPPRVGVFVSGGSLPHLSGLDEMRRETPDKYATRPPHPRAPRAYPKAGSRGYGEHHTPSCARHGICHYRLLRNARTRVLPCLRPLSTRPRSECAHVGPQVLCHRGRP